MTRNRRYPLNPETIRANEPEHYELAKRHIAQAEARIARQREIVGKLAAAGSDVSVAQGLLETMEKSLKEMQVHLRAIEAELGRGQV